MSVSFYGYIVDSSNKVIRGSDKIKVSNRYELTYIMNNSIQSKTCPCCGAELEINQASICSYCRTKITNYNHEWVLSNKRIKK